MKLLIQFTVVLSFLSELGNAFVPQRERWALKEEGRAGLDRKDMH